MIINTFYYTSHICQFTNSKSIADFHPSFPPFIPHALAINHFTNIRPRFKIIVYLCPRFQKETTKRYASVLARGNVRNFQEKCKSVV